MSIEPFEYMSLKQLGLLFGVSGIVVGRWLVEAGLRTPELLPSRKAIEYGMVKEVSTVDGGLPFIVWHRARTIKVLEAMGHRRVVAGEQEAEPLLLVGPFTLTHNGGHDYDVVATSGQRIGIRGQTNAESVLAVLNVAHRAGRLAAK